MKKKRVWRKERMNKGRKEVRKIGWMEEIKKEEKKEGTNK